jgi:hypothetical protein
LSARCITDTVPPSESIHNVAKELWSARCIAEAVPRSEYINDVAGGFGQLAALQTLYLYQNELTTLPVSVGQKLFSQCTFQSELTTLPESLGQLAALL